MTAVATRLAEVVESAATALSRISDEEAARTPAPGRWSRKQILGHLIDSAGNNHQRIVRAQVAASLEFPSYQQEEWVAVQSYATESWADLVALWTMLNRHLVHLIRVLPPEHLSRPCSIGGKDAIPLSAVVEGYLSHLEHHLGQLQA